MEATVLVNRSSPRWPAIEAWVSQAALAALAAEGRAATFLEVGVLLTSDEESRDLNRRHRGLDRPANILSFAMEEGEAGFVPPDEPTLLGDLVIPYETTLAEAAALGVTLENRLAHLVVHGILHLLGYDHERSPGEADRQEEREIAILATLGVADPYG